MQCKACGGNLYETERGYFCGYCGSIGYGSLQFKDIYEQVSHERTMRALSKQQEQLETKLDRHTKPAPKED